MSFILISGFFSSSETAFTAINRIKLRALIESKEKKTNKLEFLLKHPKRLLTCILIGNNLANIAASSYATAFFLDLFQQLELFNFAIILSITTATVTFVLLVFGEITPKTLAMKDPANWALKISPIIYYIYLLLYPLTLFFSLISALISKLFGIEQKSDTELLSEDEIKLLIQLGQEDGILHKSEQEMIHGVINVFDKIVREIMTPRTDMLCIEIKSSVAEVIQLITSKGHSRVPVYEDKIDSIIGFIYAKDLLNVNPGIKTHNLRSFMREAVFIPETKSIESLLQQMRQSKFHLAIVVDEHGGVSGLVTMEDIIEQIVGEIQDEYDKEDTSIRAISRSKYWVDAGVNIYDFGKHIHFEFPESDDYDTVAGFILSELGAFPKKGDSIMYKHLEFTINEIRNRRIISLEVEVHPEVQEEELVD